jgi:hypothetical protein
MNSLIEYHERHAKFLEKLRFDYCEEPTTDPVRKVQWLYRFPAFELPDNHNLDEPTAPFHLVLCVDYELFIGDAPDVPLSANFDYSFEGVRLELRDTHSGETLGTLPLAITTTRALKAFLAHFPSQP